MANDKVHATHCCVNCGCKYGDPYCPVVNRQVDQVYQCEDCKEEFDSPQMAELRLRLTNYERQVTDLEIENERLRKELKPFEGMNKLLNSIQKSPLIRCSEETFNRVFSSENFMKFHEEHEEEKEKIKSLLTFSINPDPNSKGQQVNSIQSSTVLRSEELNITIEIGCDRDQRKNKELCLEAFDYILMIGNVKL